MLNIYTILGWAGALAYITAYFLVSTKKIRADKPLFHWLNITGAVLMVINAVSQFDYPNVFVNVVWAVIALFALYFYNKK
ncbi:MAG: hypothetical protein J0L67_13170 [Cytophagales bacterium]|nr:hypothetical protein [Cytophagales bacterium]